MMKTPDDLSKVVALALAEDVGSGDISAQLIDEATRDNARVICRQEAVICGRPWFDEVFRQVDPAVRIDWQIAEGHTVTPGQTLCRLQGPARALLTGERTALNFLQVLSATATNAKRYADEIAGTGVKILDTRKTLPGLRTAQKYAVACAGCYNHRMGLYDGILIKENHIMAAGSISAAVRHAREQFPEQWVEVEVENFDEIREALQAGAQRLLLDNMPPATLQQAVQLVNKQAELEASGGINLQNIRAIAETGVDYISVGALTKHVRAVDLSMRFDTITKN